MKLELITRRPEGQARPTPLLFVHGAWHGAWSWERFLPYFANRGYTCHALSLRGHGESEGRRGLRWQSTADYLADIEVTVASLETPPVIIAHAMGGYLAQRYLERHTPPAAVLLAPVPITGITDFMAHYATRHPWPFLKMIFSLSAVHMGNDPEVAGDILFSRDLPAEELARHAARLQPESVRLALEASFIRPRPRPGTPMLLIAAANDQVFDLEEMTETAHAWHADLEVLPGLGHDMMLDTRWEVAAGCLATWLEGRGL